ncbi:ABC transporter permease [Natronosporangium hydrolyticum]|uniref:ABC transporter permease n=1 Tax=Natronosporangium hydrolyticum TaxID=2811111 RepID=A0A895YB75_9ACTN|nr:ABC transporter permease [Natronosporangium hydrolyticum]QSB13492.1 ABC transporter permease [Natronosporangium hydrolyticum]
MKLASWSSWLTAIRIARREIRRAKGRSALVVALIGLPVAAIAFAAVSYDSFQLTPEQTVESQLGAADASLRWQFTGPVTQDLGGGYLSGDQPRTAPPTVAQVEALLPAGSRATPMTSGYLEWLAPDGVKTIGTRQVDLTDPMLAGLAELRAGRAPATDHEVALNAAAMRLLEAEIGDEVTAVDRRYTFTVVGEVEYPRYLRPVVVIPPEVHPGLSWHADLSWLVDTPAPIDWAQVRALNRHGVVVTSRAVLLDPPAAADLPPAVAERQANAAQQPIATGSLVVALAVLQVMLLAGPAFAVGARRRQRELALVAVAGGAPAHQRRIVLADGLVLGTLGAVAGLVLGTGLALAARPLLAQYLWHSHPGGVRFFPPVLLAAAGLAVVVGVAAAATPAVIAGRQSVVRSLAGHRGAGQIRRRWLMLGLLLVTLGVAVTSVGAWLATTVLLLTGVLIAELGLVLCTPAVVGLIARLGRWAPVTLRMTLRDTARNRAAAAPAISAVMAAVAACVALGSFAISQQERDAVGYLPAVPDGSAVVSYELWTYSPYDPPARQLLPREQHPEVAAVLAAELPSADLYQLTAPDCPSGVEADRCQVQIPVPPGQECPYWDHPRELTRSQQQEAVADPRCRGGDGFMRMSIADTVVDDGTLLPVLTQADPAEIAPARATLRAGGVVVTDPRLVVDGEVTVDVTAVRLDRYGSNPITDETDLPTTVTLPGYAITTAIGQGTTFLSPAALRATELDPAVVGVVAHTQTAPTNAEEEAARAALRQIHRDLSLYVERDLTRTGASPEVLVLAATAAVVALGAAAIATGLAAADRRNDLLTLAALGASPGVRRLLSLTHAGVIAGLGTVIGALAGLGAAVAVITALNQRDHTIWPVVHPYPLTVPWAELALLLAVPLVAMLGAGLLTRSGLPLERRRT